MKKGNPDLDEILKKLEEAEAEYEEKYDRIELTQLLNREELLRKSR